MTIQFKPATRSNVRLLIGLSGGTGSGKTFSAMRLASGLSDGKPFAVIDTENGRALHYADRFRFDHADIAAPFNPAKYLDAIRSASSAGYPVIVIDSMTHEWAGEGGILDMHEAELDRMAGNDWGKREACKMAAWIKPKMQHKDMVASLLQMRSHIIMCFRAEEKIEMRKDGNNKMQIVPKESLAGVNGWIPVCEKNLPFEMTLSLMFLAKNPGVPVPIKLPEALAAGIKKDARIDESSGKFLGEWARGTTPNQTAKPFDPPSLDQKNAAAQTFNRAAAQKYTDNLIASIDSAIVDGQLQAIMTREHAALEKLEACATDLHSMIIAAHDAAAMRIAEMDREFVGDGR